MGYLLSIEDLDGQTQCIECNKYINIDYSNEYNYQLCDDCESKLSFEEQLIKHLCKNK